MTEFSKRMFEYHFAESEFSEALVDAGFGEFNRIGGDNYDNSIEFYDVANDARMAESAQKIVFDAGFSTAYVNHKDGWETHYNWRRGQPFKASRGWRRRWVADGSAATTRSIGENVSPENAGYYEISYWPDRWGDKTNGWLKDGYMRIVPDPLDKSAMADD